MLCLLATLIVAQARPNLKMFVSVLATTHLQYGLLVFLSCSDVHTRCI